MAGSYLSYLSNHHDGRVLLCPKRDSGVQSMERLCRQQPFQQVLCVSIFSTGGHLVLIMNMMAILILLPSYVMIMLPILMMFNMNK